MKYFIENLNRQIYYANNINDMNVNESIVKK